MATADQTNGADVINSLMDQLAGLVAPGDPIGDRIALTIALPVLRRAMMSGATPTHRKEARSAYRAVCAALSREH